MEYEFDNILNAGEKHLINLAKIAKRPIYGSLELSPLCNMNCDMCYVRLSKSEMDSSGRLRSADEWLSLARQMADSGVLYLQLTGGEPLIYPEFRELYSGLRSMGMILTINTNGTLIDDDWADFFAAQKPRRVNISLYGIDEQAYKDLCHFQDGFAKTLDGIKRLRARDIDVKVNVPHTSANAGDLEKYDELLTSLGVYISRDTYVFPAVRERNLPFDEDTRLLPAARAKARLAEKRRNMGADFKAAVADTIDYIEFLPENPVSSRQLSCLAGSAGFIINWQGMLRPCIMLNEPEVPVFDLGFEAAWQELRVKANSMLLPEPCGRCRLRSICDVCVASAALEPKDDSGAPIYLCETTRELYHLLRQEADLN